MVLTAESRNVLHAGAPLERTLSPQRGLLWRTTVFPRHGCAAPRGNCAKVSLSCTKAQPGPGAPCLGGAYRPAGTGQWKQWLHQTGIQRPWGCHHALPAGGMGGPGQGAPRGHSNWGGFHQRRVGFHLCLEGMDGAEGRGWTRTARGHRLAFLCRRATEAYAKPTAGPPRAQG